MPELDTRAFRNALGKFATGVTVVTAKDKNDVRVGVTASSFNSVSMDPPLVLWSLDKRAHSLNSFANADYFTVNVLAEDQVAVSDHFARKGGKDKFDGIDFEEGAGGAAVLNGSAAHFQCKKAFTYEGGDHLIFVGEVVAFTCTRRDGLVFHQGGYAVSEPHQASLRQQRESAL